MKVACSGKLAMAVVPKVWVRQKGPNIEALRNDGSTIEPTVSQAAPTSRQRKAEVGNDAKRAKLRERIHMAPTLKRRSIETLSDDAKSVSCKRERAGSASRAVNDQSTERKAA